MLIHQGSDRNEQIDKRLAALLAGIAGALNGATYYAVGFFAANMTGNISSVSDHLATGAWAKALFYLSIVTSFILGAMISALLINAGRRRNFRGIYAACILLEGILVGLVGCGDLWFFGAYRSALLVLSLALLMGLQNGTVGQISDSKVRTTHVSGLATDLGVELGRALDILRQREPASGKGQNRSKLHLYIWSIAAFLFGGLIGTLCYKWTGGWVIVGSSLCLIAIAADGLWQARARHDPDSL